MSNRKKGKHISDIAQSAAYKAENRYYKNRVQDLERHIIKHPEDIQALKALDNMSSTLYKRKKPKSSNTNIQKKYKVCKYGYGLYTMKTITEQLTGI